MPISSFIFDDKLTWFSSSSLVIKSYSEYLFFLYFAINENKCDIFSEDFTFSVYSLSLCSILNVISGNTLESPLFLLLLYHILHQYISFYHLN